MAVLVLLQYWYIKVMEWFGSLYDKGREIVIHFEDYLRYAKDWAVGTITAWVNAQVNNLVKLVVSVSSQLYTIAVQAANAVLNFLLAQFNTITTWILSQLTAVVNFLTKAYHDAIALINAVYPWVQDFVNGLINGAIATVTGIFAWINSFRDFLGKLLGIFNPTNIAKFLDFIARMYPVLLLFLANPIEFILDLIVPKFFSFLCMILAYGFGTTKYNLPPFSNWKGK